MKNLAIIPARSGSKGLKDKNIKDLNGVPLLAYSIIAAKESGLFEEIMVSTDSEEYAKIARDYGARVPFLRTEENSTDKASSWDVVKEVVKQYENMGERFDTITLLQPTSPLREAIDIQNGYALFREKNAKAVVAVTEMDHSPLWSNTLPENRSMKGFVREEVKNRPRQELDSYYRINGALYIVSRQLLDQIETLYGEGTYALVMEQRKSIDIDTEMDFAIAEVIQRKRNEK